MRICVYGLGSWARYEVRENAGTFLEISVADYERGSGKGGRKKRAESAKISRLAVCNQKHHAWYYVM
ncbi:predicted protein [Botrytis cinerea T4]|uniref:Uncharacterized protein n=1 Tax=Botryotinia fuckeliana (strain T4) TaxID=999810 RepID=G2YGX6_BOTF4|nr:predicted protein [Botrytis cinerea T4]